MKQCPQCKRTYSDDTYRFCLDDGSSLVEAFDDNATWVSGKLAHHEVDTTIATLNSTESTEIKDQVVAICINQQFPYCRSAEDLYQSTRGVWRLSKARANRAKYAFAVYKGVVKEVYEIDKWVKATKESSEFWMSRLERLGRPINPAALEGRSEFIGKIAPEQVRKKYLGRNIPERHRGNPILYFNCEA